MHSRQTLPALGKSSVPSFAPFCHGCHSTIPSGYSGVNAKKKKKKRKEEEKKKLERTEEEHGDSIYI